LICDRDNRTFNPAVIAAHLLSLGWKLDAAIQRVEGIYRIVFSPLQLSCLRRWEQTLTERRTEIRTCESRSRTNSLQSCPTLAPPPPSIASSTSLPAISAISVINPAYYHTAFARHTETVSSAFAPPQMAAITTCAPAISAVSLVNPLWTASVPLISAQSVINPYWNTLVAPPPVMETIIAPLVAPPVIQPIIQPVISMGPAISAVSLVNPYWNQVTATSVVNPVWNERHTRTEIAGRIEMPARHESSSWHARSLPATSSEHFEVASNPLARHPLTGITEVSRHSSGNAALADCVEATAIRRARSLQRGQSFEPEVHHYARDITSFG